MKRLANLCISEERMAGQCIASIGLDVLAPLFVPSKVTLLRRWRQRKETVCR